MEDTQKILQADSETIRVLKVRSEGSEISGGNNAVAEQFFDNLVWMTSVEAAAYLRKSVGALRTAVCRGQIRARKWRRRLFFKRTDLDRMLEDSELKGGF